MASNTALSLADCSAVLETVQTQPGLTTTEIAKRFPYLRRQQVYIRLKWLRNAGLVESEGGRSGVTWHAVKEPPDG